MSAQPNFFGWNDAPEVPPSALWEPGLGQVHQRVLYRGWRTQVVPTGYVRVYDPSGECDGQTYGSVALARDHIDREIAARRAAVQPDLF